MKEDFQIRHHTFQSPAPTRNPYFPRHQPEQDGKKDRWAILGIIGLLICGSLYAGLVSNFFNVTVTIRGNQWIPTERIQEQVDAVLQQKVVGMFSRKNFWLFNPETANAQIEEHIQSDLAIAELETRKKFPRTIIIEVRERIPSLYWLSGSRIYTMDLDGIITQELPAVDPLKPFPKIVDDNKRAVRLKDQMINPDLITWIFELHSIIPQQSLFTIEAYHVPAVACSKTTTITKKQTREELDSQNKSQSEEEKLRSIQEKLRAGEINITESLELIQRSQGEGESIANDPEEGEKPETVITYETRREPKPCAYTDVIDEVQVKTSQGPALYFDHQRSVADQMTSLQLVINEKIEQPETLQYIDLRFSDRVYYR